VMREGISHYALLNRVTEKGKKVLQKDARGEVLSADRTSLHKEIGDFALEFFNETLH
jgi:hypothetical protein